ncbi:AIR synthase family protein [Marinoscillum sp.]|uniref:AIR synthase family protein n=1 Tax=Marinoscillum sp. TaxID=2024838 RepID=UPI003BAD1BA8
MGAFDSKSGKVGEIDFKELLLGSLGAERPEVIHGAQFGVDTSIIDLGGGQGLAISSDPLSLIPSMGMEVSAWLSVHLLVNDMATTGFCPQYAQFVLNLPTSLSKEDFSSYWSHIHSLCKKLGISITGGHTGQIPGQESTISGGGTMFLHAPIHQMITSNRAQAGDKLIMSKSAGLSSTSLLAMAFPDSVSDQLGSEIQQKAAANFWQLSALPEALTARRVLANDELHAMHDVTEGGILGALYELARASECGFQVDLKAIPLYEEALSVAELFDINPLKSIGAGSMIFAVKPGSEQKLIASLEKEGIDGAVVGELTDESVFQCTDYQNQEKKYHPTGIDPYWEAFFTALNKGWK